MHATLKGLDIFSIGTGNACLQAPSSEKHCIMCITDFGIEHEGKSVLTVRAAHGSKSAGRDFRNHLRSCMSFLDFKPCLANPDA